MNGLEVPKPLAGARIEREQAIGIEVVAMPVPAVEFVLGGCRGHVCGSSLHVDCDFAPHVDAAHIFIGILGPGFISILARTGNRVEYPHELTGKHIESPDISWRREIAF